MEHWTKRGFKLPRFISINTAILSYQHTNCLSLAKRGVSHPCCVARRFVSPGERQRNRWVYCETIVFMEFAYQVFVAVFRGPGSPGASKFWTGSMRGRNSGLEKENNDPVGLFIQIGCVTGREKNSIGSLVIGCFGADMLAISASFSYQA